MTIPIAGGTTLRRAEDGVAMTVEDESTAEIVAFNYDEDLYTVKFEDGEEYHVSRSALAASREIYINPGNSIGRRFDVYGREI